MIANRDVSRTVVGLIDRTGVMASNVQPQPQPQFRFLPPPRLQSQAQTQDQPLSAFSPPVRTQPRAQPLLKSRRLTLPHSQAYHQVPPQSGIIKSQFSLQPKVRLDSQSRPLARKVLSESKRSTKAKHLTPKDIVKAKMSKEWLFALSLQGPPPPAPSGTRCNVPRETVDIILRCASLVYATNSIAKDGNCMFSAFAMGLGDTLDTPALVRKTAIRWMGSHSENFLPFISVGEEGQVEAFRNYLQKMSQPGEWGDNLVLQALCKAYKVKVSVLKKRENGTMMWTHWGDSQWQRCFWLYLANNHYENLYPEELLVGWSDDMMGHDSSVRHFLCLSDYLININLHLSASTHLPPPTCLHQHLHLMTHQLGTFSA